MIKVCYNLNKAMYYVHNTRTDTYYWVIGNNVFAAICLEKPPSLPPYASRNIIDIDFLIGNKEIKALLLEIHQTGTVSRDVEISYEEANILPRNNI